MVNQIFDVNEQRATRKLEKLLPFSHTFPAPGSSLLHSVSWLSCLLTSSRTLLGLSWHLGASVCFPGLTAAFLPSSGHSVDPTDASKGAAPS